AYPLMRESGVRSSWLTLATNSCREFSSCLRRVKSWKTSTVPCRSPWPLQMAAALICTQLSLRPESFSSYPSTCFCESRELTKSASSCRRNASMRVRPRMSIVTLNRLANARLASWMRPRSSSRSRPSTMLSKSTSCWVWFCKAARRCSACKASTSLRDVCWARANLPRHQRCKPARAARETAIRTGRDMKGAKPQVQTRLCSTAYSRALKESVADAAHRIEVFGGGAKLIAQAAHVGIDGAGINETIVIPHIAQQLVPGLHASAALRQERQQLELGRGQLDWLAAQLDQVL